jgi:hypothetical protein
MRRRTVTLLLILAVALVAGGCTGAVRSFGVYASKAANTAEQARSAVATAQLAVRAASEHRAFGRTTALTLAEAAEDAGSVQGTFDAIQPPDRRSDRLRQDLDDLLDQAVSTLEGLRTAARRGQVGELSRLAAPLWELSGKLEELAEAYR